MVPDISIRSLISYGKNFESDYNQPKIDSYWFDDLRIIGFQYYTEGVFISIYIDWNL